MNSTDCRTDEGGDVAIGSDFKTRSRPYCSKTSSSGSVRAASAQSVAGGCANVNFRSGSCGFVASGSGGDDTGRNGVYVACKRMGHSSSVRRLPLLVGGEFRGDEGGELTANDRG